MRPRSSKPCLRSFWTAYLSCLYVALMIRVTPVHRQLVLRRNFAIERGGRAAHADRRRPTGFRPVPHGDLGLDGAVSSANGEVDGARGARGRPGGPAGATASGAGDRLLDRGGRGRAGQVRLGAARGSR